MKHLLNSIEAGGIDVSNVNADIKQLLTDVRDLKHARCSEGFYEALDKILVELRSGDHAYPFLKPVRRSEAPNYDMVIKHPMDLATMTKKVKTHVYKTQREFVDDLNLIWDNCLKYNTDPSHPIRRSTVFMRKKADQAVERILGSADRIPNLILPVTNGVSTQQIANRSSGISGKDRRLDHELSPKNKSKAAGGKTAKLLNGVSHSRSDGYHVGPNDARIGDGRSSLSTAKLRQNGSTQSPKSFPDSPAIIRTPQTMQHYWDLDHDMQKYLDSAGAGPSKPSPFSSSRIGFLLDEGLNSLRRKFHSVLHDGEPQHDFLAREYQNNLTFSNELEAEGNGSSRQHKRLRMNADSPVSRTHIAEDSQSVGMWWGAVWSDDLIANGMPGLRSADDGFSSHVPAVTALKRKRKANNRLTSPMKGIMYKNIDTLRRIRRTHTALLGSIPSSAGSDPPDYVPPTPRIPDPPTAVPPDDLKPIPLEGGAEVAEQMLKRNCALLLEHAGFEASGKGPLDVVTDLAAEYVKNVGRTLKFLSEQHSDTMSSEEMMLHTLFESGIARVQDLEGYIRDDVERYGTRLTELRRKLDTAYNELLDSEPIIEDGDGLFAEDGDALITGDFSSALGEDFFGFKELGLDKEFSLSSMSIPSRLFHGHGKRKDPRGQEGASKEPPLRFPPPQPFIPLTSHKLGKQIGLLRPFYQSKFEKVRDALPSNNTALPPPSAIIGQPPDRPPRPPVDDPSAPTLELADEGPNQLKIKMSPLGQISLTTGPTSKKKPAKASAPIPPPGNALTNGIRIPSPTKSETMAVTPAFTTFQLENPPLPELSNGPGFAPNGITPSPVDVNGTAKASAPPIPPPPNPPSTSKKKKTKKDLNPPQPPSNPKPPSHFPVMVS